MASFKSDSSFFNKIAIGAVGSRAVKVDLSAHGHDVIELERGSLDAKIWKNVKRKRVRIPDLVCIHCGQRIEVRTKSEPKISMSHSENIPERRWDYGMVDADIVAIPVCTKENSEGKATTIQWTRGVLTEETSYWNEKKWIKWRIEGGMNYFTVAAFRNAPPDKRETKGAEEGSETVLIWRACFSPCDGVVESITAANITVKNAEGKYVRRGCKDLRPLVKVGDQVQHNQVVACNVVPVVHSGLKCKGGLKTSDIAEMLRSQHLPVRFAGIKLARVRREESLMKTIGSIAANRDEDIYARLEAKAYLATLEAHGVEELFSEALKAFDKPDQLEAVIALGEVGTEQAATVLARILNSQSTSYFLRSAAAYCLGRINCSISRTALIRAFTAQTHQVREDALIALTDAGFEAMSDVLRGINSSDAEVQAGCAEVIRWLALQSDKATVEGKIVPEVTQLLKRDDRSLLAVWLGGQLPEQFMRAALGEVLNDDARLAYSLAVAWAFARSWIVPIHDTFHPPHINYD